jgi:putative Holliday junction resolvase
MIAGGTLAFRDALPAGGRLLGLDVGTRTIGVAFGAAGWTIASPAELIRRAKFTVDVARIRTLVAEQGIKGLVVGLPLNLDGTDSPRCPMAGGCWGWTSGPRRSAPPCATPAGRSPAPPS